MPRLSKDKNRPLKRNFSAEDLDEGQDMRLGSKVPSLSATIVMADEAANEFVI